MDIPTELPGILSWLGLPAGAILLAYWLPKGADWLEEDAKAERLKYISDLLKKGPLTGFGPLGAAVVPFVFYKVFGTKPLSLKFMARAISLSLLFWLILILAKHPHWLEIWRAIGDNRDSLIGNSTIIIAVLAADWISLAKSRLILLFMEERVRVTWTIIFVLVDVLTTYLLPMLLMDLAVSLLYFILILGDKAKLWVNDISPSFSLIMFFKYLFNQATTLGSLQTIT
jgi:hypothetical protein